MLRYAPGDGIAHDIDPRTKLAFQVAFVAATVVHADPAGVVALTALALASLWAARLSLRRVLVAFRVPIALVAAGPVIAGITFGEPWFRVDDAAASAVAGYQVVLALLVAGAYVRSTPVRDSRAAVQRTVPGRPGQFLGAGMALVFRFFPVLLADLRAIQEAHRTRLGDRRGWIERAGLLGGAGLERTFDRADRLALALRARCFAWNPTLPELAFTRRDLPVLAVTGVLVASLAV